MISRPGSLAEVLQLAREGEEFRYCIVGFLDEFYADTTREARYNRIEVDPGFLEDSRTDALIGAIGEHLCHRWDLGTAPNWTNQPERFLKRPPERMKGFLLAESPMAFSAAFHFQAIRFCRLELRRVQHR